MTCEMFQQGKVSKFSAQCKVSPGEDSHWVVQDVDQDDVSDIRCKDARQCNEPPPLANTLVSDFDDYKINVDDSCSYFCPSKEKGKF